MEDVDQVSSVQGVSSSGSFISKQKQDLLAQAQTQSQRTDANLLSQLSNNPFFTAVGDGSTFVWTGHGLILICLPGVRSCWAGCGIEHCAEGPPSWRGPRSSAHAGGCGNQCQGRLLPLVPELDDSLPTTIALWFTCTWKKRMDGQDSTEANTGHTTSLHSNAKGRACEWCHWNPFHSRPRCWKAYSSV